MSRSDERTDAGDYRPGAAGDAQVERAGERWVLVFVRTLKHSPERVWRALTDPAELSEWASFDPDRDLGSPGRVTLTMAGGDGQEKAAGSVLRAEPPTLLEYRWGDDVLRWELEPAGTGTRLILRHQVSGPEWLSKVAAGWHICIDVADAFMSGAPVGRIVADDAMKHGWERLNEEYAARFR
ncbi:MAG: SRPBCC family protein [Longimicrobiales bacterium]